MKKLYIIIISITTISIAFFAYNFFTNQKTQETEAAPTKTGLIGHWNMDNESINGTTVYDTSELNNGILTGTTATAGKIKEARAFNGSSDYITIPFNPILKFTTNMGIGGWAHRDSWQNFSSSNEKFISNTEIGGYQIGFNVAGGWEGKAVILAYINGSYRSAEYNLSALSPGWHHFFGTYDGRYLKFYVDGNLVDTYDGVSTNPITYTYDNAVMIGAEPYLDSTVWGDYYFDGSIDDVRIYNYALSAEEVSNLYSSAKTNYSSRPTKTGLIGHWNMDSESINGTTVYDTSGQNNHGTSANTPTVVAGKIGQAMSFNGSSDYVVIPSDKIYQLDVFTISAWAKVESLPPSQGVIFIHDRQNGDTAPNKHFEFRIDSAGNLYSGWEASNGDNRLITYANFWNDHKTNWVHLVMTRNSSGTGYLYVDGINQGTTSGTIDTTNTDNIMIGVMRGTNSPGSETLFFNGSVDDVRVYNYALSAEEVSNLYSSAKTNYSSRPTKTGLIGYWSMDDDSIYSTNVYDTSGNNNHGTSANTPTVVAGKIGQAMSFNGSSDRILLDDTSDILEMAEKDFSFFSWVYPESYSSVWRSVIGGELGAASFGMVDPAGYLKLTKVDLADAPSSNYIIPLNEWSFVGVTFDTDSPTNNVKYFVNGVLVATVSFNNDFTANAGSYLIGKRTLSFWGTDHNFDGKIDEVRIYDRTLSVDEVSTIYNATRINYIR